MENSVGTLEFVELEFYDLFNSSNLVKLKREHALALDDRT